jgi:hypothetical protein
MAGRLVQRGRGPAFEAMEVESHAATLRHPDRRHPLTEAESDRIARWNVRKRGLRGATDWAGEIERLPHPPAALVAVGVVEPPDPFAVRTESAASRALWPVGHLTVPIEGAVPCVQLGGACRVRSVQRSMGGVSRPSGEANFRGGEPLRPCGSVSHPAILPEASSGHPAVGDRVPRSGAKPPRPRPTRATTIPTRTIGFRDRRLASRTIQLPAGHPSRRLMTMTMPVTPLLVGRRHLDFGRMRSMLCLSAR